MELIYHMNGNRLEITCNIKNTGKEKNVYFPEAPLFGLWSAEKKNAPYAAIEPWFGRCDKEDFNGSLEEREWGHVLAQVHAFRQHTP